MALFSNSWEALRAWWQGATPATRALATGLTLMLVVGLIFAASFAASPDFQPIYHGVSGKDAAAIESVLREHSIVMRFDDKDGTVSVPSKDGSNATMYIEAADIIGKDTTPDLDPATNISPMDSPEVITQKTNAAKEIAMSRKLMCLDPVQSAAVSISAGSSTTLFGNDTPPSASVILTLKQGESLSALQVKGIVNLVAHAVTGLTPQNVTLTDQSGVPWPPPGEGGAGDDDDPTRQNADFSARETKRVQSQLDETFGPHKVLVTVNAELNFDQVHKDETLHPVLPGSGAGTLVSTRTNEETYSGGGAAPAAVGGVAGAASNLNIPSYQTNRSAGSGGGKYVKTDTVENHDPNVSHIITQVAPGTVKRESAAALVDAAVPADNLPKIKDYIASAILAQPGDTSRFVSVQQIAFDTSAAKAQAAQAASLASQQLWSTVARALAVAAVAIVLLILLMRSGGRRSREPQLALAGGGANLGLLHSAPEAELASGMDRESLEQSGILRSADRMVEERPLTVEDVLAEMPDIDPQRPRRRARAPSIEEQQDLKMESIRTMINGHPESVALLLKGWMAEDVKGI